MSEEFACIMAQPKRTRVLERKTFTVAINVKRSVLWSISSGKQAGETSTPVAMVFTPPRGRLYTKEFMRMVARQDGYPGIPCWNVTTNCDQ